MSTPNLYMYSGLIPSHTRPWQSRSERCDFAKWTRSRNQKPRIEDRAEDQGFSIPNNAILEAFEMIPFASIRQSAKMIFIPPTTGSRRLTKSLHIVLKRLYWITIDSWIFKNRLVSSCQKSYWSCLSPWDSIRGNT
jgi:hypothetical protein